MGFFEDIGEFFFGSSDSQPAPQETPAAPPAPPPLPPAPDPNAASMAAQEQALADKRKKVQTLLTGARGDTTAAPVGKKKLLGE